MKITKKNSVFNWDFTLSMNIIKDNFNYEPENYNFEKNWLLNYEKRIETESSFEDYCKKNEILRQSLDDFLNFCEEVPQLTERQNDLLVTYATNPIPFWLYENEIDVQITEKSIPFRSDFWNRRVYINESDKIYLNRIAFIDELYGKVWDENFLKRKRMEFVLYDKPDLSNVKELLIRNEKYNTEISRQEEIRDKSFCEKQRRNQTYQVMEYFTQKQNLFSYCSIDTFKIIENALKLSSCVRDKLSIPKFGENLSRPFLSSEFLFISYFYTSNHAMTETLDTSVSSLNFRKSLDESFPKLLDKIDKTKFSEQIFNKISQLKRLAEKVIEKVVSPFPSIRHQKVENPLFSTEVTDIFERAVENAFLIFKTPIITPEIVFYTMMEKETTISNIIKNCFGNDDSKWNLFRVNLLTRSHEQESLLRSTIEPTELYFAYLLKVDMKDSEYAALLKDSFKFGLRVQEYRHDIISTVLDGNMHDELRTDIHNCLELTTNERNYSKE